MPTPLTTLADERGDRSGQHARAREGSSALDARSTSVRPLGWRPRSARIGTRFAGRVATIREHGGDPVLQEIVRGRLVHYLVFVDGASEIIAGVQTLAEPLFYPGAGCRSAGSIGLCASRRRTAQETGALMRELGWVGMASLNLLLPDEGGEPTLIDFNGRYGASFDQYIAAGSNFPAMWACQATGRPLPPIRPVKVGVRFQWLEGDLRRAVKQRRGGLIA